MIEHVPRWPNFSGDRGYATAGFVANTWYCAADSGLARGFTRLPGLHHPQAHRAQDGRAGEPGTESPRATSIIRRIGLSPPGCRPYIERLWRSLDDDRKGAETVNRELLDWLAYRAQPERPFFAFLNYFDAHYPYQLPPGRLHRFGVEPTENYQRLLIQQWGLLDKTTVSPAGVAFAADAYDDCIADLDERLGKLVDELEPARGSGANLVDHHLGPR